MANWTRGAGRFQRLLNRLHARLAARGPLAQGFVADPEPRTIGSVERGTHLLGGRFLFGGHLVEDSGGRLWDIAAPDGEFDDDRHGFVWLDDLIALGTPDARSLARGWTASWIENYGDGRGPGWRPGLTGRRVSRWISHGFILMENEDSEFRPAFLKSISQQTHFLARRHPMATPGLPKFEALGGLIQASLLLEGMRRYLDPAIDSLAEACRTHIDQNGGIVSRNPQELLDIFAILTWAAASLSEAGFIVPRDHLSAIERIAPVLRSLRHSDGGLARFHGGGRGEDGRLDQALAASNQKAVPASGLAMGYARLSGGRTSVIVDGAPPPTGLVSVNGHASTLAFELTSGRRPLIVNCGPGSIFGQTWHRAGRATPSHSTLGIEGTSSARLGRRVWIGDREVELLVDGPKNVTAVFETDDEETSLNLGHDGYLREHGLHHNRHLRLSTDGRMLDGEDEIAALTKPERKKLDVHRATYAGGGSIGYAIRFHLHPDVDAEIEQGRVLLKTKSGEEWELAATGQVSMTLEPSLYLEKNRLEPRATKQIVLNGAVLEYADRITWTLAKTANTPQVVRDFSWGAKDVDADQ